VLGIFEIGSQEPFAQGWLWIVILLMSASRVARITGVSHQHLAKDSNSEMTKKEKFIYEYH
jgi:hypothetical protein